MRMGEKQSTAGSRVATAIATRSATLASPVRKAVDSIHSAYLDDAFLATKKGMGYRIRPGNAGHPGP